MKEIIELRPSNYFQLISDPTEKVTILYEVAESCRVILAKSVETGSSIFRLEPLAVSGSSLMVRPLSPLPLQDNEDEIIIHFQIANQKYIGQTTVRRTRDAWALNMSKKLFRVQRREFYRLKIPATAKGVLFVPQLKLQFPLVDLSGGGCKVEIRSEVVPLPSQIGFDGRLRFPKKEEIPVKCVIRHQLKVNRPETVSLVGVQFMSQEQETNRIASLVMDLYRDFFTRM